MGFLCISAPVFAIASELSLDGKSFVGKLKAKNTWLRIGVKGSIHFEAGQFYWTTGKKDQDIQTAPYQLHQSGSHVIFTARVPESLDSQDFVDWQGQYDGHTLSNVQAIWTRVEKDFIHDLMLPELVTFQFNSTQQQPQSVQYLKDHEL